MNAGERTIDELKAVGSGKPATHAVARVYHEAFAEFGTMALWSRRASEHPTITQALVIADTLRREGDLRARAVAARLELLCRAAL